MGDAKNGQSTSTDTPFRLHVGVMVSGKMDMLGRKTVEGGRDYI